MELPFGSLGVKVSIRCWNIGITIAASPVELDLRGWCGTVFEQPQAFPSEFTTLWSGLSGVLFTMGSPSPR
jgi:hypothetical protein